VALWVEEYRALEREVQEAMGDLCAKACAACRDRCCKEVFCREARDSPFLEHVRQGIDETVYDRKRGWLGPRGCGIAVGRPPVCYEYVCPEILGELAGPEERYAANVLGEVVAWVGKAAMLDAHPVELDRRGFRSLRGTRLLDRIAEGRRVVEGCKRALTGQPPWPGDVALLAYVAGD
jgi:hypothetical protein